MLDRLNECVIFFFCTLGFPYFFHFSKVHQKGDKPTIRAVERVSNKEKERDYDLSSKATLSLDDSPSSSPSPAVLSRPASPAVALSPLKVTISSRTNLLESSSGRERIGGDREKDANRLQCAPSTGSQARKPLSPPMEKDEDGEKVASRKLAILEREILYWASLDDDTQVAARVRKWAVTRNLGSLSRFNHPGQAENVGKKDILSTPSVSYDKSSNYLKETTLNPGKPEEEKETEGVEEEKENYKRVIKGKLATEKDVPEAMEILSQLRFLSTHFPIS